MIPRRHIVRGFRRNDAGQYKKDCDDANSRQRSKMNSHKKSIIDCQNPRALAILNGERLRSGFISSEAASSSGFLPLPRRDEGAYPQGSVTEEQRRQGQKAAEMAPPNPYETTSKTKALL